MANYIPAEAEPVPTGPNPVVNYKPDPNTPPDPLSEGFLAEQEEARARSRDNEAKKHASGQPAPSAELGSTQPAHVPLQVPTDPKNQHKSEHQPPAEALVRKDEGLVHEPVEAAKVREASKPADWGWDDATQEGQSESDDQQEHRRDGEGRSSAGPGGRIGHAGSRNEPQKEGKEVSPKRGK